MSSIIELYYPNQKLRCRVLEKLPSLIVVVGHAWYDGAVKVLEVKDRTGSDGRTSEDGHRQD